jgi:hypothetical protein
MSQPDSKPEAPVFNDPMQVPSFRLVYLVLWIAATILVLTLNIPIDSTFFRDFPGIGPWTTYVFHAINASIFGAVLVATGILFRFCRSTTTNLQPGHWLIINSTVANILSILFFTIWQSTVAKDAKGDSAVMLGAVVSCLFSATLFWFATTRLPESEQWRGTFRVFVMWAFFGAITAVCFSLSTSNVLSGLVFVILMGVTAVFGILALICFISSVATDLRTKCRRDWLHWLGVVQIIATAVVGVAWRIATTLHVPH